MYAGRAAVEPAKDGEDRCPNHSAAYRREVHDIVGEMACVSRVVDAGIVMLNNAAVVTRLAPSQLDCYCRLVDINFPCRSRCKVVAGS